ncbi:MAG TPA: hypothetical protein VFQ61_03295 [Polyangiaceae bacterium]|nr:hypothetical protein [Polyangiaceae bacterium]
MPIKDLIRAALLVLRRNWRVLLGQSACLLAAELALEIALFLSLGPVAGFVRVLMAPFVAGVLLSAAHSAAKGERPKLRTAVAHAARAWPALLSVAAATYAGLLVFGLGVVATSTLFLFSPLCVMLGKGPREALRISLELVAQRPLQMCLLNLVLGAAYYGSYLVPFVGPLLAPVVSALLLAQTFERLSAAHSQLAPSHV